MPHLRGIALAFALFGAVVGCAKDQTLDDYNQQKYLDDLAKYQAVQGRYSGVVTNDREKRPLGGLELILQARLKSDVSGGGAAGTAGAGAAGNTAKPVLITELHFQDVRYTRIVASGGYYDPNSGVYQADFSVQAANGTVRSISLAANISGGHIRGTLQGVGAEAQSSSFDLALNGRAIDDLAKLGKPAPGPIKEGQRLTYPAKFRWSKNDPIRDVYLHAYYPVISPTEHFVEVFAPDDEKVLQIDMVFSEDVNVPFDGAVWNSQTGEVVGTNTISNPSGSVTRQLRCSNFFFAATAHKFTCMYWSSRTSAVTITFDPAIPEP